ncbi:MAG: hypothetical protein HOP07_17935 [Bacteriovoracaceae bacterium]|nr:hypothetical protein [Bacteriovoracaceae bacterium]
MKTKFILSHLFVLSLITSCSTQLKNRDVTQYYSGMGLEKYFLSEIPTWANFSSVGNCFRSKSIQYLDIGALMKSFNLSFIDALQIQATFNEDYLGVKKDPNAKMTFKDLEIIYFKASQKVTGKINFFDAPDFKTIHLIWIDEILADKTLEKEKKLKSFLQSDVHNNGFPILVSACLTKSEIAEKFPGQSFKILSAELFSSYDNTGSAIPGLKLDLGTLFKANQNIIFYTQKSPRFNDDIRGNYKPLAY